MSEIFLLPSSWNHSCLNNWSHEGRFSGLIFKHLDTQTICCQTNVLKRKFYWYLCSIWRGPLVTLICSSCLASICKCQLVSFLHKFVCWSSFQKSRFPNSRYHTPWKCSTRLLLSLLLSKCYFRYSHRCMTSGAMYINVPLIVVAWVALNVDRSCKNLDDPKSAILMTPMLEMRMLEGLISKMHGAGHVLKK